MTEKRTPVHFPVAVNMNLVIGFDASGGITHCHINLQHSLGHGSSGTIFANTKLILGRENDTKRRIQERLIEFIDEARTRYVQVLGEQDH